MNKINIVNIVITLTLPELFQNGSTIVIPIPFHKQGIKASTNSIQRSSSISRVHSPAILDVLVDDHRHRHRDQCHVPRRHEHDRNAERQAEQRQRPVVVLEARPPVRGAQQRLHGARQIHEAVAHQEEHGQQRRQDVNVACAPAERKTGVSTMLMRRSMGGENGVWEL